MMKKMVIWMLAAWLVAGMAMGGILNQDEPGEWTVSGQYWFPGDGDFDLFEYGVGGAVSYREWFSFPWGVGLNLGVASWSVDSGASAYKYDKLTEYDGDCLLIPLGASLYFNVIDWDNWNLLLGTGLQYVFVNSDVRVFNSESGTKAWQDVDIDGGLLWNLELEYEYMLTESAYVLGGVGYQVDVIRAGSDYDGGELRDTSFRGAFLRLGAKFLF